MSSSHSKKRRRTGTSSRSNASVETDQPFEHGSVNLRSHASENSLSPETEYNKEEEENPLDTEDPRLFVESEEKMQDGKKNGKEVRIYLKQTNKRGKFWTQYKSYKDKEGLLRAECIYCNKTFAADPIKNGTGNLSRHYDGERPCEKNPKNKTKGTQSQIVLEKIDAVGNCEMGTWVLDQVKGRKKLGKCIIGCELPFTLVEKYEFRDFIKSLCPDFKMPSRPTITRDCHGIYGEEKEDLNDYLRKNSQRVCFTTDTWTSIQNINYMTLTAHFIDNDWKLQKRILNFCPISSHKGDDIARAVEDCLRPWGLLDKVFTISLDNASSNDVACAVLKELLVANGSAIYNGKFLHMRCTAHISNLIVQDGLKIHDKCIDKVRKVVLFVRSSPPRMRMFKEEGEKLGVQCKSSLVLDVSTRWNSTYLMLDVALKYKLVFARLDTPRDIDGELIGRITAEEWAKVEKIRDFLEVFYEFTNHVSGSSYVTVSNVFFFIAQIVVTLNERLKSSDPFFRAMAGNMKEKLDKYWGTVEKMNAFMFVGIILDPKRKFDGLRLQLQDIYGEEKGEGLAIQMKNVAKGLFDEYRSIYSPPSSEVVTGPEVSNKVSSKTAAPNILKSLDSRLDMLDECDGALYTSEFDRYFHELRLRASECEDVLTWWKLNGHRFPIMARLARDVLAIPVTSVASESAFSTGGRTLNHYRSSLGYQTVEALICSQNWIRASRDSHDVVDLEVDEIQTLRESEQIEEDLEKERLS